MASPLACSFCCCCVLLAAVAVVCVAGACGSLDEQTPMG